MEKIEIEEKIVAMLKTVYDPEIPVNVYDLGLIYKIDVSDNGEVVLDMTDVYKRQFLDCLFKYLSPIGRLYLAEKEVHEIPPCVLVQFVVQSSESFKIAVDVRFHHIHEDVVHLVISALLRCRLAVRCV